MIKKTGIGKYTGLGLTLALLFFSLMPIKATMAAGTSLAVTPVNQTIEIGDTVSIGISLTTDVPVIGAMLTVNYSPSILRCDSVEEGTLLITWAQSHGGFTNVIPTPPVIDENSGTISLCICIQGVSTGGPTGTGTFCLANFTALSEGTSTITISDVSVVAASGIILTETERSIGQIIVEQNSGSDPNPDPDTGTPFANGENALSVNPYCQSVEIGDTIDINIAIETDLPSRGMECGLSFDAAILRCDGVSLNDTFYGPWASDNDGMALPVGIPATIDNINGIVEPAGVAIFGGNTGGPTGSGAVFTYHFEALANGSAPVSITDTWVTDVDGLEIPMSINNGQIKVGLPCSMPDLSLRSLSKQWITEGSQYKLTCIIDNESSVNTPASNTLINIDGMEVATIICPALDGGQSATVTSDPITISDITDEIEVCADGDNSIVETNEQNNCQTLTVSLLPGIPSSLSATASSSTTVTLNWVDNADNETGFNIERAIDSAFSKDLRTYDVGSDITGFSDGYVYPSTTYYYRICATNEAGNSEWASYTSITTTSAILDLDLPKDPTGLEFTVTDGKEVKLTWRDNALNETGFRIQRATNSSFTNNERSYTTNKNSLTYTDTGGVSAGTTYYYRVQAYNDDGDSAWTNVVEVPIPGAPVDLTATIINIDQVNLAWEDTANNERGYRIERSTNSAFNSGLISFHVGMNGEYYADIQVEPSTTYYYRVYAFNDECDSPASNSVVITMPSDPDTPPPPPPAQRVDIADKISDIGMVNKDIKLTNISGIKELVLDSGCLALCRDGTPLKTIEVGFVDLPPLVRNEYSLLSCPSVFKPIKWVNIPPITIAFEHTGSIIGQILALTPEGSVFIPSGKLTLEYDPTSFDTAMNDKDLVIAYYNVETGKWIELRSSVDTEDHTITADLDHFSIYAIMRKGEVIVDWWKLAGILAAEVFIGISFIIFTGRRRLFTN